MKTLLLALFLFGLYFCTMDDDNKAETDEVVVVLDSTVNPVEFAERHGYEYVRENINLKDHHLLRKAPYHDAAKHPHFNTAKRSEMYEFHPQYRRKLYKRTYSAPTDPSYLSQWHIHSSDLGVNVKPAWERGFNGEGVVIALVDDGIQKEHPDMSNYEDNGSVDINNKDDNPGPHTASDNHGTSAAGCAAARDNGVCGVGTAYRATLTSIRLIAKSTTDQEESEGIGFMPQRNEIYSNSWGPNDDGKRLEGPGPLAWKSLNKSMIEGREGKGAIYVWAAGNGRSSSDNCNYDGWANNKWTISIPAVDYRGNQAYYSEDCSANVVSAPSSGSVKSITTTDLLGRLGTSVADCTSSFGGTSAAAPIAAGVVALLLQANRELTWRDVQHILIKSARHFSPSDSSWRRNGAEIDYSHRFGFGMINGDSAVEEAENWNLVPEVSSIVMSDKPNIDIPDFNTTGLTIPVNVTEHIDHLEHVELKMSIKHPHRGEFSIKLVSPSGTISELANPRPDIKADYQGWKMMTIFNWGERSPGVWLIKVADVKKGSTGKVTDYELTLWGTRGRE